MHKLKYMAALLALLCLAACSPGKEMPDISPNEQMHFLSEWDDRYYLWSGFGVFTHSDSSYYFLGYGQQFLCKSDKQSLQTTVLCNKPDCLHAYEEDYYRRYQCNAYVGSGITAIRFINNTLYGLSNMYYEDFYEWVTDNANNPAIVQISIDGSGYKTLLRLEHYIDSFCIHRGYLYAGYTWKYDVQPKDRYTITRYDLSALKKPPEILYEKDTQQQTTMIVAKGNNIFANFVGIRAQGEQASFLCVDSTTGECEEYLGEAEVFLSFFYDQDIDPGQGFNQEVYDYLQQDSAYMVFLRQHPVYTPLGFYNGYYVFDTLDTFEEERYLLLLNEDLKEVKRVAIGKKAADVFGMCDGTVFYKGEMGDYGYYSIMMLSVIDAIEADAQPEVLFSENKRP